MVHAPRYMLTALCRYIEGIVRGYRNGLLTGANYSNMTQCENVDGAFKVSW